MIKMKCVWEKTVSFRKSWSLMFWIQERICPSLWFSHWGRSRLSILSSGLTISYIHEISAHGRSSIDIQLQQGRILRVGRSRSAKSDGCGLNVSSYHPSRYTSPSREHVSALALFGVCFPVNELAIEKQKIERWGMARYFIMAHRQKQHMSAACFQQCTPIVLIEFIDSLWTNDEFARKPVTSWWRTFGLTGDETHCRLWEKRMSEWSFSCPIRFKYTSPSVSVYLTC
jgi:hypothetical protein